MTETNDHTTSGTEPKAESPPTKSETEGQRMKEQAKAKGQRAKSEAKAKAKRARERIETDPRYQNAKETARAKTRQAKSYVREQASARQGNIAERVSHVADALRAAGDELAAQDEPFAGYAESAGEGVDAIARYLDEHEPEDLLFEARASARQNPAFFVGGAFILGFVGGRFLKAGSDGALLEASSRHPQTERLPEWEQPREEEIHGYR